MSDYFSCDGCGNRSEGYCLSCGACPSDKKSYCFHHLMGCVGVGHHILWGYPKPFTTTGNAVAELASSADGFRSAVVNLFLNLVRRA